MSYRLIVKAGYYEAPTLWGLAWEVLKHRIEHWLAGDGFVD